MDRHSLGLIWLVYLTAIFLGIFASAHLQACELPCHRQIAIVSFVLCFLGVAFRWYAIVHLGRFFTTNVAIAKNHRVVDTGPYRFIRHPSYTGALLAAFALGLSFGNWAVLLIIFLPILTATCWRMHVEEAALLGALGERYRSYMQRTWRLLPGIY
jgi:protein-S-isoprenylcysteine O-methyltransferase